MGTRRTRFRVLGAGLAVYGLIGVVIFIAVAVGVARPLERARQLSVSIDEQRAALVKSLTEAESTIRSMSTSVDNMDTSLGDAKTAIDHASTISHGVATSMYGLRDAVGLSILGAQPLVGLAGNFDATGQNLDQLGGDISAIGTALDTNRADVQTTSQNLTDVADSVQTLTEAVRDGPAATISTSTIDAIRLGVYAVTLWLVVFALGCVAAGLYLINATRKRPTQPVAAD